MKKYLFCSFGNVAQREFRNLRKIQPDCLINIYTHKYEQHRIFDNELNITYTDDLNKIYYINNIFNSLDESINAEKYDAVFIYTLPPERINIAIDVAKKGFNFFIEKPLSNNLDKVYELQEIVEINKLKCSIGYQMRFSPILKKLKDMVYNREFGSIYRIEVCHCNGIFNWTKGRNIVDNFYALSNDSGGLLLTQAVHEIDYLSWIFGKHYPVSAICGQWLDGVNSYVEDNVSIMSSLELDNKCIPIIINLDFLSKIPIRKITIYGTKKTETFDLMDKSIVWNDLFIYRLNAFLKSLDDAWEYPLAKLEDGVSSLEYIMDIKDKFTKE